MQHEGSLREGGKYVQVRSGAANLVSIQFSACACNKEGRVNEAMCEPQTVEQCDGTGENASSNIRRCDRPDGRLKSGSRVSMDGTRICRCRWQRSHKEFWFLQSHELEGNSTNFWGVHLV